MFKVLTLCELYLGMKYVNSKEWGMDYSTNYQDLLPGQPFSNQVIHITIATGGASHNSLEDIQKTVSKTLIAPHYNMATSSRMTVMCPSFH